MPDAEPETTETPTDPPNLGGLAIRESVDLDAVEGYVVVDAVGDDNDVLARGHLRSEDALSFGIGMIQAATVSAVEADLLGVLGPDVKGQTLAAVLVGALRRRRRQPDLKVGAHVIMIAVCPRCAAAVVGDDAIRGWCPDCQEFTRGDDEKDAEPEPAEPEPAEPPAEAEPEPGATDG